MAVHLNRVLPNAHFRKRKLWPKLTKTWFNQAAKKVKRREARAAKAVQIAPRPLAGSFRPVVQCPTFRYNAKQRLGRGFSLEEIKAAGLDKNGARRIGICIDTRRRNKSAENLARNVARLKAYKQKIVVLKKTDKTDIEQSLARKIMPVVGIPAVPVEARVITDDERKGSTYQAFHMAKANVKFAGQREKRAAKRAAEAEEKKTRKK
jgi:large subunit ribosomal protein L13e